MNRDDLTYIFNNMIKETKYIKLKTTTYFLKNNSDWQKPFFFLKYM